MQVNKKNSYYWCHCSDGKYMVRVMINAAFVHISSMSFNSLKFLLR